MFYLSFILLSYEKSVLSQNVSLREIKYWFLWMVFLKLFQEAVENHLHELQIWPPDGAICIRCKFDQQMVPFA